MQFRTQRLPLLLLLILSISPFLEAQSSPPYVIVYNEKNFRGSNRRFDIGEYRELGNWKDQIESVVMVGGVRIVLYDKEQYQGKNTVVERSSADLGDFKGKAASFRIEPFHCSIAVAYRKTVFGGTPREFPIGEYRTLNDGWENSIQSIDICGDIRVTLYEKKEFQGDKVTIDRGTIDLGKFKKKAASIIVEQLLPQQ
jgi:hypothetical protein